MKNSKRLKKEQEVLNERFYYLPEGGIVAAVIASPFALCVGLDPKRLEKLIDGSEPEFEEIELIQWAYEIGMCIITAVLTENLDVKTYALNEAMRFAAEYLDQQDARKALGLTLRALKDEDDNRKRFN